MGQDESELKQSSCRELTNELKLTIKLKGSCGIIKKIPMFQAALAVAVLKEVRFECED